MKPKFPPFIRRAQFSDRSVSGPDRDRRGAIPRTVGQLIILGIRCLCPRLGVGDAVDRFRHRRSGVVRGIYYHAVNVGPRRALGGGRRRRRVGRPSKWLKNATNALQHDYRSTEGAAGVSRQALSGVFSHETINETTSFQ